MKIVGKKKQGTVLFTDLLSGDTFEREGKKCLKVGLFNYIELDSYKLLGFTCELSKINTTVTPIPALLLWGAEAIEEFESKALTCEVTVG